MGYARRLRQRAYAYADFFGAALATRTVDLVAFAREPLSYDTACIAAVCANGSRDAELVVRLRALGAPLVFEVTTHGEAVRWQVSGRSEPRRLDVIPANHIRQAFWRRRAEWDPDTVFRAKCIPESPRARQLDFFDLGLMPAIGEAASRKLSELLEDVLTRAVQTYRDGHNNKAPNDAHLFALIFRFIASKVLGDRGHPGAWLDEDAHAALAKVNDYYFGSRPGPPALRDRNVQDTTWHRIRGAFHFENVSADALAYVYENTLITPHTRRTLGTHSTPPAVAEYLVRHLPFEELALDDIHVFEPCAGHGVFLVAAMRRIRELLGPGLSPGARHDFFVRCLTGIELDPFACEVARLSLMLADYPNPNGWDITNEDVFAADVVSLRMQAGSIVLCNPPFEAFTAAERKQYGGSIEHIAKPAEVLSRVLSAGPPAMLGFVLPRTFVTGRTYRLFHERIRDSYGRVELVALPDRVFTHSDAESALLLACEGRRASGTECQVRSSIVYDAGRRAFLADGSVGWDTLRSSPPEAPSLWTTPSEEVWERLDAAPKLRDVAEVHRGIEFSLPLDEEHRDRLISSRRRRGFVKGLHTVPEHLNEAFVLKGHVWLNTSEDVMRGNAHRRPWHEPKIVLNAATASRGPWRLVPALDVTGLVCYQNFHGIWPIGLWPISVLAAVLNGPVANAYARDHEGKRHNRRVTLSSIPLPCLSVSELERLDALVTEYMALRGALPPAALSDQQLHHLGTCLRRIDALVLQGYDLPPRLERKLLDQFSGHRRPVPFPFTEFFPSDFTACIPYHEFVSPRFRRASARATLARLQPIRDEAIHEAMEHLRWLSGEDD
ncbi:N-6 DNA methylase [bacterium]|nr:N-6 DNA methylase [bacterium]